MSVGESRDSSPSVDASDSPSPAPSSSQTPTHPGYSNGQNGCGDFSRFGSPVPPSQLPSHMQMHRVQSCSPAGMQMMHSPIDDHQFIKRPLNAYMIWTVQERKKILAKDPKMKMNDVSRLMGEKWKTLTDKEKRPFFEMSKQNKLEHKKVLKDNPNLVYHPQRKKPLKGLIKQESPLLPMDVAPGTPLNNRSSTPISHPPSQARLNGYSGSPYPPPATLQGPGGCGGTVLVAQALGVRPVSQQATTSSQVAPISFTFQTPQSHHGHSSQRLTHGYQGSTPQSVALHQNPSANMHHMLDMYYTSLCQPAFPEPGESNNMAPPQYYLDQYQQLHYQALSQQYGHQGFSSAHASFSAI